jgi:hypothetical protein
VLNTLCAVHPTHAAIACVQQLAAAALRLEAGEELGPVADPGRRGPFVGVSGDDLVAAAVRHRVTDLLHGQAPGLGLEGTFGEATVARLAGAHADVVRRVAVQLLEARRVLEVLDGRGVPALVLKGPALAVQTAGTSTARGFGDIDIFVAPSSVELAFRVLAEHGWAPRTFGSASPGTWAWRHLVRTFNEIAFDGRASSVDLHWRLDPSPGALPDFDEAWARRDLVPVDGVVTLPTLSPADAFEHSCWHAAKDEWRWLRSLVDVHRLARQPAVWEARTGPARGPVRNTLAVTDHFLGLPSAVPQHLRPAGSRNRAVRRAESRQRQEPSARHPFPAAQSARDLRHRLQAARGPRAVALAVTAVAIPAPSVAGIEDRSGWTAVPRLVLKRLLWLGSRALRWTVPDRAPGGAAETTATRDRLSRTGS